MKFIIKLFILVLAFSSCKKEETKLISEKSEQVILNKIPLSSNEDFSGFYVGYFEVANYDNVKQGASYSNKINLSIDRIVGDSIFGHSIVAGNSRPYKGYFNKQTLKAVAEEPGDDKYDGVFKFTIDNYSKSSISGTWKAFKTNLKVTERKYNLEKRTFKYVPELNLNYTEDYDYTIPLNSRQSEGDEMGDIEAINPKIVSKINASTKKLTNQDLENLNKGELQIIRNLIYARHGYSFKNRKMRYFFDSKIDWYIPVSTDVRKEITDLELKNIALIKRYEQHAEKYYDYFGR